MKEKRYWLVRPLRLMVRGWIILLAGIPGTTYREIAEMSHPRGPCPRCVGKHVVEGGERAPDFAATRVKAPMYLRPILEDDQTERDKKLT